MEKINRSTGSLLISPFFILFILSNFQNANSQTDTTQFDKWSATASGGITFPFDRDIYKNSVNTGFEIIYNYNPYSAIFLNCEFDFLKFNYEPGGVDPYFNYYYPSQSISRLETSIGARFHLNPEHDNFFIELGLGCYQTFKYTTGVDYSYSDNIDELGFNIGMGYEIKIYKKINISATAKLHLLNLLSGGNLEAYWGLYPGIKYSF